jgi:glycosyltransferase involved in cell wall biosynthesis
MRVSVIIPTYNRAGLISEAIDSVLVQSLQDREIIVVDDGSTDDTAERLRVYGSKLTYIRTEHGGVGHARNVGARHAAGQYLVFLDSDDLLYPYALEVQAGILDRYPELALVYSEASAFDDRGFWEEFHLRTYHRSAYRRGVTYARMFERSVSVAELALLPRTLADSRPDFLERRLFMGNIFDTYLQDLVVFTASLMMRREIMSEIGLRNEAVAYWEEVDYVLRICRTRAVGFLDLPTYKLRYHPGQVSTTARTDGGYVWLRKQQGLLRIVKRHALSDPSYYESRRRTIDVQLARLHRAAAVPLLLYGSGTRATRRRYARRARPYLRQCRENGRPEPLLWLLSFSPGPIRRLGVTIIEKLRQWPASTWVMRRLSGRPGNVRAQLVA